MKITLKWLCVALAVVGACAAPADTAPADNSEAAADYCAQLVNCGLQADDVTIGTCVALADGLSDDCATFFELCAFPCAGMVECVEMYECTAYGAKP